MHVTVILTLTLVFLCVSESTLAQRRTPAFTLSNRTSFYAKSGLSDYDKDIGARRGDVVVVVRPRKRRGDKMKRGRCIPKVPVVSPSVADQNGAQPTSTSSAQNVDLDVILWIALLNQGLPLYSSMLTTTTATLTAAPPPTSTKMSSSSRTITTVRRSSAPRVSLAARAHIDLTGTGLTSIAGARKIISVIQTRKSVTKLLLGHNSLGSDGTRELFRYLSSEEGRRYQIAEINLVSNSIGNEGLEATAEYLEGNSALRELYLQNNAFEAETAMPTKFSKAINTSHLSLLQLSSNPRLSDAFFIPFISSLSSPFLRELQISLLGLTRVSAPALTEYCASGRARALETLKCNGNALGMRALGAFLERLRRGNFTLLKLEVYTSADVRDAERGEDEDGEEGERGEESVEERRARWIKSEQEMKNMLVRNELLRRRVHEEALALLVYARALLLVSSPRRSSSSSSLPQPPTLNPAHKEPSTAATTPPHFPFHALPTELQQYILTLHAPSLSPLQRARIFAYAADPSTLRPLLPSLRRNGNEGTGGGGGGGCIPDPASLPFGLTTQIPNPKSNTNTNTNLLNSSLSNILPLPSMAPTSTSTSLCAGGKCMGAGGSVVCHRAELRMRWLREVGCVTFDSEGRPGERGEGDVFWLIGRDVDGV